MSSLCEFSALKKDNHNIAEDSSGNINNNNRSLVNNNNGSMNNINILPTIEVLINNKLKQEALIDTGSSVNVISQGLLIY